MLDVLNILTLIGAVQGIFFGLVLLGLPRGNRTANRWLAVFLLNFSICMISVVWYVSRWVLDFPHLGLLHAPFSAVLSTPLFMYILALTQKEFRFRPWHTLLFLPFVLVLLWEMPFYGLPAAEKRAYLLASYGGFPLPWKLSFAFSALCNFVCLIACYFVILRHERVIREVYSNPWNKTLLWTRHFLHAGMATFVVCVLISFVDVAWADPVSNLLFSVIIYVFGYRAIRQPDIFVDVRADTLPEEVALPVIRQPGKYEKSGMSEPRAREWLDKLERLMSTEQPYLDPTLNLQQLAARLGVSPHQLSQLLNQFRGESFSDFVNRHRIGYFKRALADPNNAHLSLLALAFESGFNSKAAFNAVFKKMTGMPPSVFRENPGV